MLTYKKLDTNLVSVNQLSFVNDDAVNYEIEYSKDYDDAYPLYLVFNDVDVYFSCVDGKKILSFCSNSKNNRVLENYKNSGMNSKKKLEQ